MCRHLQFPGRLRAAGFMCKSFNVNGLQAVCRFGVESALVQYPPQVAVLGERMELTQSAAVAQKPRQTMLPLLVVLFLISYVLLTTLVVLQSRTLDSQSSLINLLFKDNFTLVTKIGLHRVQASRLNQKTATTSSAQASSNQTSSTQALSSTAPSTQVPVIQAKPDVTAKAGQKSRKVQKAMPSRPPAEVTDPSDMRRTSFSI
jgi:hypothetical protein